MPRLITALVGGCSSANHTGKGVTYTIQTPTGVLYCVHIDEQADIVFRKSTDGGLTWTFNSVRLFSGTATQLAVWYDRWSDIAAGKIHCAYTESVTDETFYRSIDTENSDALSTQTTIFSGASTAANASLSITRARGGNLYCRTCIDGGTEGGFYRSTDVGATWSVRTVNEALASGDQMILAPGFAADSQDIIGIFWDSSADEISRQLYDDSANTWAETSIAASMVDDLSSLGFAAAVDIANSQVILAAWSGYDTANADLRCWTVTESAITEKTNVVLNGTDDQGFCAVALNTVTGHWHVFYCGKSDGSETANNSWNVYQKISTDSGSTWSAEILVTDTIGEKRMLAATPRFTGNWAVMFDSAGPIEYTMQVICTVGFPRAQAMLGI